MASPRRVLLDAMAASLRRIRKDAGYLTDAGTTVTLEPKQIDETAEALLGVLWVRQERPSEPSQSRTSRLTTVSLVVKVPARIDEAQERLDEVVSDVEMAMADQQFRYPPGYEFPKYAASEPAKPETGAGWIGALLTYQSHIPIK